MVKNPSRQTGSIFIVIIIVLVIAMIAGLSLIFWNNYTSSKTVQSSPAPSKTQTQSQSSRNLVYSGKGFSFEYPKSGWVLKVDTFGEGNDPTPSIQTSDYKPMGPGIDSGAIVSVTVTKASSSLDDQIASAQGLPDSASDVKRTTIGGEPAFSFSSGYEGLRYYTMVDHNNQTYQITYRFKDGGDATTYRSAYDTLTSSFKFLN